MQIHDSIYGQASAPSHRTQGAPKGRQKGYRQISSYTCKVFEEQKKHGTLDKSSMFFFFFAGGL